jgi:hypothetical protein
MANPLTVITGLAGGKSHEAKGVVKRDWVPNWAHRFRHQSEWQCRSARRIQAARRRTQDRREHRRHENLEIQWRLATLKEAKAVVTQYHKYLKENSLIRSVSDPEILPPGT